MPQTTTWEGTGMRVRGRSLERWTARGHRAATAVVAAAAAAVLVTAISSAATAGSATGLPGAGLWTQVDAHLPASHDGAEADVQPDKLHAFTLNAGGLAGLLDSSSTPSVAPRLAATTSADEPGVVSLPD